MLRPRTATSLLTLGALFSLLGVAPFCPPASVPEMPCCSPTSHCDAGMKSAGCCRVEPSPATSHPQTLQRAAQVYDPRAALPVAALEAGSASPAHAASAGTASCSPLPAHFDPVPLYLLNASILR